MNFSNLMPEPGSFLDRAATFLMANMVWFMLSVMVLPLPAATAGLFSTTAPWVRGQDTEIFRMFTRGMRRNWLKSTVVMIANVIVVALVIFNFQVINTMPQSPVLWLLRSANAFVALTLFMMNVYVWPLMTLFDLPVRRLVVLSGQMAFAHPLWTFVTLILMTGLLLFGLLMPPVVRVLTVFASMSIVVNWGAWRIIKQYATDDEIRELNLSV